MISREELIRAARDYGLDADAAEMAVEDISRQVDLVTFDLLRSYVRSATKSKEVTIP